MPCTFTLRTRRFGQHPSLTVYCYPAFGILGGNKSGHSFAIDEQIQPALFCLEDFDLKGFVSKRGAIGFAGWSQV